MTMTLHHERRQWTLAGAGVLLAHAGAIAAILLVKGHAALPVEEPVMVVDLPPPGPAEVATSPALAATQPMAQAQPVDQPLPDFVPPQIQVPTTSAPLPREAVSLPTPPRIPAVAAAPRPTVAAAAPAPAAAVAPREQGAGDAPGNDAKAKKKAADYYSLLMAHLQRKKHYPAEAKQARQQGVVTVRFTVDRSGAVTSSAIKKSSGHTLLDHATLDLMQRVSPLPPIPREMGRDSVTISLPIDYALSSK